MKTTASNLRRVELIDQLPDGIYDGFWGGYTVTFTANGATYDAKTEKGIRHVCCPVRVTSKGGQLVIKLIEQDKRRIAQEKKEGTRVQMRLDALAKLNMDDRRILGL